MATNKSVRAHEVYDLAHALSEKYRELSAGHERAPYTGVLIVVADFELQAAAVHSTTTAMHCREILELIMATGERPATGEPEVLKVKMTDEQTTVTPADDRHD